METKCCDKEMIHTPLQTMNGDSSEIWICPVCFSFIEHRDGQMDQDDVLSCLGIDAGEIENYDTISDEDLTKEILRLYERDNIDLDKRGD
jgi:hypothetical protein